MGWQVSILYWINCILFKYSTVFYTIESVIKKKGGKRGWWWNAPMHSCTHTWGEGKGWCSEETPTCSLGVRVRGQWQGIPSLHVLGMRMRVSDKKIPMRSHLGQGWGLAARIPMCLLRVRVRGWQQGMPPLHLLGARCHKGEGLW